MSLTRYRHKRSFERTPEPKAKKKAGKGPLRFVVQKHHARRLHYDFRLELDGVLKSWAVPKGPSLNPNDKRLAIMVEDHPLDYATFEGVIPEGNYGAGAVIVWDQGTYHAPEAPSRKATEQQIRVGLEKGHLRFILQGEKLQGEFSLVKLQRGEANAWLLIKKRDPAAADTDVTADDRSVASERTLADVASQPGVPERIRRAARKQQPIDLGNAPKAPMPKNVRPMLASLVNEPFDRPGWLFELKYDGYRAIAELGKNRVRLYSRNQKSFEERFRPLVEVLRGIDHEAVLDGEVVALDSEGKAQFQLLQNHHKTGKGQLAYFVFDLLYLDGHDLRGLPLVQRKQILRQVLPDLPTVKFSDHIEDRGSAFFHLAAERELEGIIAKNGASRYADGVRGLDWLKIKTHRRQEAVICGFTQPRGSRKDLGALVLGVYDHGKLTYIGHTGGGFNSASLGDVYGRLKDLVQKRCPFSKPPRTNAPVHWVRPELVCEVTFQEWTEDGRMRQPIFAGLRDDKAAQTVRRETPKSLPARLRPATSGDERRPAAAGKATNGNGALATLTHLNKVYWPDDGLTKGDLIAYYRDVASVIVPYLKDRPESLHRHPNGVAAASFFQKDMSRQHLPEWVETVRVESEIDQDALTYALCQNEASLLYLANLGCIELNPWNSRVGSLDRPDYLVIDLDPEAIPFANVVQTALAVRNLLDNAGAASYCKTSGKRGLHVYVPLAARYDYEQARQFAELVAHIVNGRLLETTSVERRPAVRQQRVYLDYLQNKRGATLAAPYCVRPVAGAPASTPLRWQEVNSKLDPAKFTIHTMRRRLDKLGDLWKPVLAEGINLAAVLGRVEKQLVPKAARQKA